MTGPQVGAIEAPPGGGALDRGVAALAVLLFAVAAAPAAWGLVTLWIDRPEYSHGFLMVPAAGWLAWERRSSLRKAWNGPSLLGALALGVALAVLLAGELLNWPVLAAYGLVLALAGLVWSLGGGAALRATLPILAVLALACPLPGRLQWALTWPLKRTASQLATGLLDATGAPATLEGNVIHLQGFETLWIADACSGIHSLISLLALVALAGVLFRPGWLRFLVLVASCVPIAVGLNAVRIWLTGTLALRVGPEAAQGFFHTFEGFGLFLAGALVLWGWAALLRRFWPGDAS